MSAQSCMVALSYSGAAISIRIFRCLDWTRSVMTGQIGAGRQRSAGGYRQRMAAPFEVIGVVV